MVTGHRCYCDCQTWWGDVVLRVRWKTQVVGDCVGAGACFRAAFCFGLAIGDREHRIGVASVHDALDGGRHVHRISDRHVND